MHAFWYHCKTDDGLHIVCRSIIKGYLLTYLLTYNNVGLISKVSKEIASETAENRRCREPHCRLTPRVQGLPPPEYRINLILLESSH